MQFMHCVEHHYEECRYANCRVIIIINMQSVVTLCVTFFIVMLIMVMLGDWLRSTAIKERASQVTFHKLESFSKTFAINEKWASLMLIGCK
jgi:hypothetical protein